MEYGKTAHGISMSYWWGKKRKTDGDMLVPLASEEEFEIACNLLVKEGLI